ncbi:hypothetical protein FOMPIDRAFT_87324 [Fomitopsis schrenkii]|uniref:Uncharacterized protein n=1 Tax=Fomitopsis schrenkii TaxID=2126942 RepID=S8EYU9_FOMSC|nr:hypothetical protein FOMPIDRAFT_87324 [Fomitopsis schrenkii]
MSISEDTPYPSSSSCTSHHLQRKMETGQCSLFKIPPGSTPVASGENYYGADVLYGAVDVFVPYPCPPLQASMGFHQAQYLDSLRDRCLIIERFSDIIYSSRTLPYDAGRILHDMHTFVLAHVQAPTTRTTGPGVMSMQPMQLEGSVSANVVGNHSQLEGRVLWG